MYSRAQECKGMQSRRKTKKKNRIEEQLRINPEMGGMEEMAMLISFQRTFSCSN